MPSPVRLIVLRYCLGMTLSVSTLIIFSGAATPSRTVNLSICLAVCGAGRSPAGIYLLAHVLVGEPVSTPDQVRGRLSPEHALFIAILAGAEAPKPVLTRGGLDRLHVAVGQAEMMADLVHQHVGDERAQGLVVFGPVVEHRAAIEKDHVGHLHRRAFVAERQADAVEQAEQVELALRLHLLEHLVAGEIVDPDDEVLAQRAEPRGQPAERRDGERLELAEARRLDRPPGERIGERRIGHGVDFFARGSAQIGEIEIDGEPDQGEEAQRPADAPAPQLRRIGGAVRTDCVLAAEMVGGAARRAGEGRPGERVVAAQLLERRERLAPARLVAVMVAGHGGKHTIFATLTRPAGWGSVGRIIRGIAMGTYRFGWVAAALLGFVVLDAAPAAAGPDGGTQARATDFSAQVRRVRPRIEIRPRPALYRECVDGYRVVPRPYWGTNVVMPYMRCWWVRG